MIKTFRGKLAAESQDRIRLSTMKGMVGYQITKFQLIQTEPGEANLEHTVKLYSKEQTAINNTIDFTDDDLLGAGLYSEGSGHADPGFIVIVFDKEIFNQDIYITHSENVATTAVNYYLELDVIPLSEMAAEYTTIKDLRQYTRPVIVG